MYSECQMTHSTLPHVCTSVYAYCMCVHLYTLPHVCTCTAIYTYLLSVCITCNLMYVCADISFMNITQERKLGSKYFKKKGK